MIKLFDRVLRVEIGSILAFESGGRHGDMRVDVSAKGNMVLASDPSTVTIYNMSEATRRSLAQSGAVCTVKAGYATTPLAVVAQGQIYYVETERQGGEMVTTLHLWPMHHQQLSSGVISRTWKAGTSIAELVKQACRELNVTVKSDLNRHVSGVLGPKGLSFSGTAIQLFNKLQEEYDFSLSVVGDAIQALDDHKAFRSARVRLDASSGLISCQYAVPNPLEFVSSVTISAMFIPSVFPGGLVHVVSKSAGINREFQVHSVEYNLSSHDQTWEMNITSELWQ